MLSAADVATGRVYILARPIWSGQFRDAEHESPSSPIAIEQELIALVGSEHVHAGASFMFARADVAAHERAAAAADELFHLAIRLGGSVHCGIRDLCDPRGLLNPGKKAA